MVSFGNRARSRARASTSAGSYRDGAMRSIDQLGREMFPDQLGDPLDEKLERDDDQRRKRAERKRSRGLRLPRGGLRGGVIGDYVLQQFWDSFKNTPSGSQCFVAGCGSPIEHVAYSAVNACAHFTGCLGTPSTTAFNQANTWLESVALITGNNPPTDNDKNNWRWCNDWWTRIAIGLVRYERTTTELSPLENPGLGTLSVAPVERPYWWPDDNPHQDPVPRRWPQRRPAQRPDPQEDPYRDPQQRPRPRMRVTTVVVAPGAQGDPRLHRPPVRRITPMPKPAPAPRGTVEKKLSFSSTFAWSVVMTALDTYSETIDMTRAAFKSIPLKWRCGSWYSIPGRAKPRWRPPRYRCAKNDGACHLRAYHDAVSRGLVDPTNTFLQLAANQLTDAAIGRADARHAEITNAKGDLADYGKFKNQQQAIRAHGEGLMRYARKECP